MSDFTHTTMATGTESQGSYDVAMISLFYDDGPSQTHSLPVDCGLRQARIIAEVLFQKAVSAASAQCSAFEDSYGRDYEGDWDWEPLFPMLMQLTDQHGNPIDEYEYTTQEWRLMDDVP
ncbi:hypothetical protein [Alloalcanivorax xenomutans]|uniref:Uncharacterized protein n=1 Tax=Alloalcanivorax xenomutans TaxID=1094342 RepID=A0A9Q3ZF08_9GAMM|nr:hypothetical protein [Alloalcanivorax xenomutans]MCE7511290.1 hypothetical protein [Alloalcanivorax xenomutans]